MGGASILRVFNSSQRNRSHANSLRVLKLRKQPEMKANSFVCADLGTHRMAYTEWGSPSARPSVVCVHGLTRNGRDFDRLAAALEAAGRHVLCPDIVGRGQSDFLANPD